MLPGEANLTHRLGRAVDGITVEGGNRPQEAGHALGSCEQLPPRRLDRSPVLLPVLNA
jgi:hypothetical protein